MFDGSRNVTGAYAGDYQGNLWEFDLSSTNPADWKIATEDPLDASGNTPASGMSMESVEAKFGAPSRRVPAVGGASTAQPPITRWEYPGFVVYFENNHVVHTVVTPS